MDRKYQAIFRDHDWALQKYHGWRALYDSDAILVLNKKYGPVNRYLILAENADARDVEGVMRNLAISPLFDEIYLRDFSDCDGHRKTIGGRQFHRVGDRDRLLNNATFAIDLQPEENELWANMKTDYRRECGKALERGVSVAFLEAFEASTMDIFFARHAALEKEHDLDDLDRDLVRAMVDNRDVFLAFARQDDEILAMALIYVCATKAYFLHGVGSQVKNDLSGRLLHWETMKRLKNRGIAWYDLGGVPEISDSNGIYTFKKRFGGQLVRFGTEYLCRPWSVGAFRVAIRRLRSLRQLVCVW